MGTLIGIIKECNIYKTKKLVESYYDNESSIPKDCLSS